MLVQTVEIEEAEHREILSLPTFHRTLADYLCNVLVVNVVEARDARPSMPVLTDGIRV